ncbi:putative phosphoesterase [Balamuthia mandrillaris]
MQNTAAEEELPTENEAVCRPLKGKTTNTKNGSTKTPLWRCKACRWHLFLPVTSEEEKKEACPICSGSFELSEEESSPPFRPPNPFASSLSSSSCREEEENEEQEGERRGKVQVYNIGTVKQRKKKGIPPKEEGATRFVCISDTHSKHRQLDLPEADVLIHCGDFSLSCKEEELLDFTEWIAELPFAHKIVIAGNHDVMMDTVFYEHHWWRYHRQKVEHHIQLKQRLEEVCTYLEHKLYQVNGINIFGSPWVPYYHDWAFMLDDEATLAEGWRMIPPTVDVLVTHGPPRGIRDGPMTAGCIPLAEAVLKRIKPAVHCFGHIHAGYGMAKRGSSVFLNAATVNNRYKVANTPIVFDVYK